MFLDLYSKKEGNPFFTKIWVVDSYTNTLLKLSKIMRHTYIRLSWNFIEENLELKEMKELKASLP